MSINSLGLAGRYTSTIFLTSTRSLCNLCNRNRNLLTPTTNAVEHRLRHYSDDSNDDHASSKWKFKTSDATNDTSGLQKWTLTGLRGIAGKYKVFQDFDSPIILDVDEERELLRNNPEQLEEVLTKMDPYAEMNLAHGRTGVIDIDELIDVLKKENASDIVVISVPPERQYVDYLTIVTGKSKKHIWALSAFIRGLYKRKKYEHESIPQLEGDKDSTWLAMDLGNTALHVFTREAREYYDLEILWSVGREYDDLVYKKEENYIQLLEQYTHPAMSGLTPADVDPVNIESRESIVNQKCDKN